MFSLLSSFHIRLKDFNNFGYHSLTTNNVILNLCRNAIRLMISLKVVINGSVIHSHVGKGLSKVLNL